MNLWTITLVTHEAIGATGQLKSEDGRFWILPASFVPGYPLEAALEDAHAIITNELQRRDSAPDSPLPVGNPVGGITGSPEPNTAIWPPPAKGTHESDLDCQPGPVWLDNGKFIPAGDAHQWSRSKETP